MSQLAIPDKIIIGNHVLHEAKETLVQYGKRPLIVTGKHVVKSFMMEELVSLLKECGIEYVVFDGITGEPTVDMIKEGVVAYQEGSCDFLIGIGGGSPLDAAKAIAAMVTNEGEIADFMGKEITNAVPPIVAIPTTAGTGSEATKFTIITDAKTDIKMLLKGDVLVPSLAIVDASFTTSQPVHVTAATGLDALTHAIEAYTSKKAFSLTDTLAISAVKRIMTWLETAYKEPENEKAREELAIAALEAGICINNSSVTIVHGMSRPIGALFHVPHGMSNAMLLKECLTFALDGAYDRFGRLGREVNAANDSHSDEEAAELFIKAVQALCDAVDIPTLEGYGINKEEFLAKTDKMANDAIASGSPANTRKKVTKEDCVAIYHKLF